MDFPELAQEVGKYPSNVGDDTQGKGNAYQGKQKAEHPTRKGRGENVAISY